MKELRLKDNTVVKYKEGLSESDYIALIQMSLKAYENGIESELDEFGFTRYNPIAMEKCFNRLLLIMCIDECSEEDFNKYFIEGVHLFLREDVINAKEAYNNIISISKDSLSVGNILDVNFRTLIRMIEDKMPEKDKLEKLLKKLPKEWSKIFGEHEKIVNMPKEEFDETYNIDETK